ncbi:MAG: metallophosphoesterase family protein [Verrucomicrobiales bacterium]|jgi:predicted phosphodiesterase|nr:metallophosphoesterase family protein [Verrucomicrobiales bacterium]
MRVLIVSDIHGNWPALQAVLRAEPKAKKIICLGDLVNYGPLPAECVNWAMQTTCPDNLFLQGNHDHAVGLDTDPRCSRPYRQLAKLMRTVTKRKLNREQKGFLAGLKPAAEFMLNEFCCYACHATPLQPLYTYLSREAPDEEWERQVNAADFPHFLFVGHTHVPMLARIGRTTVVNPGSVGQPKDGDPRAAYALWRGGMVSLRRVAYDVQETVGAYRACRLPDYAKSQLTAVLRSGKGELAR